ncbi:MAG TPA: MFS transporter [Stellaceae bacterium]|nr:MFS transporter [Stellaceae bacterium]
MAETAAALTRPPKKLAASEALAVACGAHALHDGLTDLLYVLLPIWQVGFGLDYASVGLLRALAAGTMAALQVPSGWLGRRLGGAIVLAAGTALVGLAYMAAGFGAGLTSLAAALALGGVGLSTQHPIASSLVARSFPGARSRIALGTYNFSGDIGKMALPAATAWLITLLGWRPAIALVGALALAAAVLIALRLRATETDAVPSGPARAAGPAHATAAGPATAVMSRGFSILLAIGVIDSATRMGFLTFLPFLLRGKGADLATVGLALTLVFAGGAAGKFVCGFLGERLGLLGAVYLTEGLTAAGILALLPLSLATSLTLLPVIGVALNGTSSVLYGTVPELAPAARREHAFGIFYTGTVGGGALSPVVYGLFANFVGVGTMMVIIAGVVLTVVPLARLLRRDFAGRVGAGP